ncbi:MAG: glycosyltransferase family 2 protein [Candidatus Omnitrophota bacterium]
MVNVLVCPVAYNEHIKLKRVIKRFLQTGFMTDMDYLVVDDGSTDGTSEMIRSFADQGVKTIRHDQRSGVGTAIRTAIRYGRQNGYDAVVIMAGNDKDDPRQIPGLLKPLEHGCDVVQGSRYLKGGGAGGDMPAYRKWATRLHPWLMSMVLGAEITDSTNGFRALRLSIFADPEIDIDQPWLNAYELEPYILFKCIRQGYRYAEVPVTKIYPDKKLGYTKMRPLTGWWSILRPVVLLALGVKK